MEREDLLEAVKTPLLAGLQGAVHGGGVVDELAAAAEGGTKTSSSSDPPGSGAAAGHTTKKAPPPPRIAICGMGGVGKTTLATAVLQTQEVRRAFQVICFVTLGQDPDVTALQQLLFQQLCGKSLPEKLVGQTEAVRDLLRAEAKKGSPPRRILVVLDDVWDAAPEGILDFVTEA